MVELDIDFNELEHMDLEDVKNIIVKFDTEDWEKEENRTIKVGNKEFFSIRLILVIGIMITILSISIDMFANINIKPISIYYVV